MAGFSNAVEVALLNLVLRGTAYGIATAAYLSLHSADPGETGINELVNTNGSLYTRKAATFDACVGDGSTGCKLHARVQWSWLPAGAVPYVGIWTLSSGGVYLGSINSGFLDSLAQFDSYWLESDTVFTLD